MSAIAASASKKVCARRKLWDLANACVTLQSHNEHVRDLAKSMRRCSELCTQLEFIYSAVWLFRFLGQLRARPSHLLAFCDRSACGRGSLCFFHFSKENVIFLGEFAKFSWPAAPT